MLGKVKQTAVAKAKRDFEREVNTIVDFSTFLIAGIDVNYDIDVTWDETAGVWCAVCDEIPLAMESNSFDALILKVKIAAYETLELNGEITDNINLCFKTVHWESIA